MGTVVRNVRNSFAQYFSQREALPATLEGIRPDKGDEFARIYSLKVFQVGFSDSFVLGVPLQAVVGKADAEGFARSVNDLWNACCDWRQCFRIFIALGTTAPRQSAQRIHCGKGSALS